MAFTAQSRRNKLWFGTENRMDWFPTPNRGADVSPSGWGAGGGLLNGGGYQLNSFGSHKNYIFEWPQSSSREVAQKMKSYADGSFGRGLIYFLDPLTWTTNVLPAMWADPSMGVGYEGASLVYGVEATGLPTSGGDDNNLPVSSAYYDLSTVAAGWRGKEDAVFIPIPEGYTLALGSIHAQSGTGRVFYREQATNGALGTITSLSPIAAGSSLVVNTFVSGGSLAGIWLYIGKTSAGAGSVTLTAMTGRIIESAKAQSTFIARNEFTNPNLVGDGTWAEVRRNYAGNPSIETGVENWSTEAGVSSITQTTNSFGIAIGNYGLRVLGASSGITLINAAVRPLSGDGGRHFLPAGKDHIGIAFSARRALANPLGMQVTAYWYDEAGVYLGATNSSQGTHTLAATTNNMTSNRYYHSINSFFEGAVSAIVILRFRDGDLVSPAPADFEAHIDAVHIDFGTDHETAEAAVRDYFDGSTTPETSINVVQPEDFRWRWLGAENASESVMEIERVEGVTTNNCVAGISTKAGKPAIRLIPTSPLNASFARFIIPAAARDSGTLMATQHKDAPITGSLAAYANRLRAQLPSQDSSEAPNVAGSFPLRDVFSDLTSLYYAILPHGGAQGSGDVWWTDIGLFAGVYDGPAFSGDSSGVVINGGNVRTQWDGEPNNSTSSAWTMPPALDALQQGPWVGGQGHSGCRFIGKPTYMNNTGVEGGQVSFAASFREVGSWANG